MNTLEAIEMENFKNGITEIFNSLDILENTRNDYKKRIKFFLSFIQENPFNINSFLEFKNHLRNRNDLKVSTKAKYLTVAKIFLKELNKIGVIPSDVTMNIKSFNQGSKHKKFGVTEEEVSLIEENISLLSDSKYNLRLKSILGLLMYQGLRQVEVSRIDVVDVDFDRAIVMIQGKSSDDKEVVNLHPKAVILLKEYIEKLQLKSGPLFFSLSNNNTNGRISKRAIHNMVVSFLNKLEIKNTSHGFRHFFTSKLIKNFSGDLLKVMKFTRHSSVDTLQVYNDDVSLKNDLPKFYDAF